MTEKQPKAKSGLRRFAGDMVYSLAGLMILNMTLSFGVYPFLRSRMGAEGNRLKEAEKCCSLQQSWV